MNTIHGVYKFIKRQGGTAWAEAEVVVEAVDFIICQVHILKPSSLRPRTYGLTTEQRRARLAQSIIKNPCEFL